VKNTLAKRRARARVRGLDKHFEGTTAMATRARRVALAKALDDVHEDRTDAAGQGGGGAGAWRSSRRRSPTSPAAGQAGALREVLFLLQAPMQQLVSVLPQRRAIDVGARRSREEESEAGAA
jgi:GTPase involved in cell partitioning and DNA repair